MTWWEERGQCEQSGNYTGKRLRKGNIVKKQGESGRRQRQGELEARSVAARRSFKLGHVNWEGRLTRERVGGVETRDEERAEIRVSEKEVREQGWSYMLI